MVTLFLVVDIVLIYATRMMLFPGADSLVAVRVYALLLSLETIAAFAGAFLVIRGIRWGFWLLVAPFYPFVALFVFSAFDDLFH